MRRDTIPIITEWKSFTPTGAWTTDTTYTGTYRRNVDTLECDVKVATSGAPGGGNSFILDIPFGLSIDGTKITADSANSIGQATAFDDTAGVVYACYTNYLNSTQVFVRYLADSGTVETLNTINKTNLFTWAADDIMYINFRVPIKGWGVS